jgi:hypothetical protein
MAITTSITEELSDLEEALSGFVDYSTAAITKPLAT